MDSFSIHTAVPYKAIYHQHQIDQHQQKYFNCTWISRSFEFL